jgi:hypothetical protein
MSIEFEKDYRVGYLLDHNYDPYYYELLSSCVIPLPAA